MRNIDKNLSVGLALSSGSARGLAHIGVLEVLEKEGVPIDMISGNSMGAVVGAAYARTKDAERIKHIALEVGWRNLAGMFEPALPKTGLLSQRKIKVYLKELIGDADFAELKIPLACVATDIISGEEMVIREGSVLDAVIASISWPVIMKINKLQGRYLVDGGVVNPVPVSVLKDNGLNFIIASNVAAKPIDKLSNHRHPALAQNDCCEAKEPNIFNIMMQFINITSYQAVKHGIAGADVVIEPAVADIGFSEFQRARECIFQGELASQTALPKIKCLMAS
jgi:NTE family protein